MTQIIIFKNPDGTCGVIHPAQKALVSEENPEGFTLEKIAEKDVPAGLPWRITTTDKLPKDRTFRGAWTDDNDTETVDIQMDKARDIHMNSIRHKRAEKFIEMGFSTKLNPDLEAAIIPQETRDKLQALRNIPQNLDLSQAQTPEELKAIWPIELTSQGE